MEHAAARAGVSKFTLSAVVNGRITGNVELWVAMADALEVSVGWLLTGEGEPWSETTKAAEASSPPPPAPPLPLSPAKLRQERQRRRR